MAKVADIQTMKVYITVHLETPSQETLLQRCYTSVRRVHPDASIVLVQSQTSLPLRGVYDATVCVNPGLSSLGAIFLAGRDEAPFVYVLHDSMVVLRELPSLPDEVDVRPIYHFRGKMCREHYPVAERVFRHRYADFLQTYTTGWLGCAVVIRPESARRIVGEDLLRQITTNLRFQAMERILPVLGSMAGLRLGSSVCGDIFASDADPWLHLSRSQESIESLLSIQLPIVKTVGGRVNVPPGEEDVYSKTAGSPIASNDFR